MPQLVPFITLVHTLYVPDNCRSKLDDLYGLLLFLRLEPFCFSPMVVHEMLLTNINVGR